jgi:hypothetical protein
MAKILAGLDLPESTRDVVQRATSLTAATSSRVPAASRAAAEARWGKGR